jgi:hypothetical protein
MEKHLLRLGLALLVALVSADGATATPFMVTSLADSGPGSLRQAVLDANGAAGADEVAFAPGLTGTVTLTSGEILITDSLLVHGPGAGVLTVSGNNKSRIFHVEKSGVAAPIDVTLSGLTLTRGVATFSANVAGGAVLADRENLTILDCVISDSVSGIEIEPPEGGFGGNVAFFGTGGETLRIADSRLTGGSAGGGGGLGGNLYVTEGKLILERSTLAGGTATNQGGGLYVEALTEDSTISLSTISGNFGSSGGGIFSPSLGAALTIESSTISGNTSGYLGGGIEFDRGNLQIINSTISGNHADSATGGGGGIVDSDGSLLLRLTTVSNNTAVRIGGSILLGGSLGTVELDHSIVANGVPQDLGAFPTNVPATFTANYSLIEAPGIEILAGAHNLVGVDPLLGPLADNGGPTLTHRPLPGSPVIDAGNPAIPSPPATDQRGFARIFGPAIDLGSVEAGLDTVAVPALSQMGTLVLCALLFAAGLWRLRQAGSAPPRPG